MLAAIQHAREIIAAGNLIFYDDAPPVWVCRVCGEVALRTLPDHCPQCGAGALVFQFFPAAFYLEPEPVPMIMAQLARTPDWLEAALRGLDRRTDQRSAWTAQKARGHCMKRRDTCWTRSISSPQRVELFMEHSRAQPQRQSDVAGRRVGQIVCQPRSPPSFACRAKRC